MGSSENRRAAIRDVALVNAHSIKGSSAPSHVEYIDISSVGTGEFTEPPKLMSFADAPSRARRIVKAGDTILSTVRPNRRSFLFLASPSSIAVASTGFAVLTPTTAVDARYLYYWVTRQDFTDYLSLHAKGAAYPAVSAEDIGNGEIELPSLPVQQRIAGILSAYDELIENSQRRIKILEAMARALYREWFVHFRFPGHENHPLVASPLGEIPQGWEVKKLGNLADISWGDTSTTKASYVEEGYAAYSATGSDGKLDHYDFDRTGIVLSAIGAQCGKTWLARGQWSCIKNTIRFWSKNECVSTEYLFIATEGQDFWPRRGAAQPFISQGDAERIDLLTPDCETMRRFTIFAADSLERIATLDMQIRNLRLTRDLLLPRLLSGQIKLEITEIG